MSQVQVLIAFKAALNLSLKKFGELEEEGHHIWRLVIIKKKAGAVRDYYFLYIIGWKKPKIGLELK